MSPQIAVRVEQGLVEGLDAMVADGKFRTRAEAIRSAIETMLDQERRRKIGEAIVEGYRRIPPDDELDDWSDVALDDALAAMDADEDREGLSW